MMGGTVVLRHLSHIRFVQHNSGIGPQSSRTRYSKRQLRHEVVFQIVYAG